MSVVGYRFNMQIYDTTAQANVADLGDYTLFFILADSVTPGSVYDTSLNFFINNIVPVEEAPLLGGPVPLTGDGIFECLRSLMPGCVQVPIESTYYASNYRTRFYYKNDPSYYMEASIGFTGSYSSGELTLHIGSTNLGNMLGSYSRPINASTYGFSWTVFTGDSIENATAKYHCVITSVGSSLATRVEKKILADNSNLANIKTFFSNLTPYVEPTDPFDGAGDSGPGGGEGTFDYTGNPPGGWDPSLTPDINATDTGFVTLFNPTIAELQSLSNYLWSSAFDLNTFKKIFNDPMELFIGLSIVPVSVPNGGRKQVGIGLIDTGVYMTLAATQWVTVDCGTLNVPNFTGSYLDYDPYTRVEIYLPFIGVRSLKADEVSGKAVHVGYWVDLLSGACVAWIDINNVPMYQFMGQCATSIPMASGEWTSLINGIIGAVGAVASGAAAGGAGGAIAGGVAAASSVAVNDSKIEVVRSGAITSAAGLVALQMPVLYISAPNLHKPARQNQFEGYPAYYTATLGDVTGYTTIESIRLQGIPATEPELEEIETLLKGGVIL